MPKKRASRLHSRDRKPFSLGIGYFLKPRRGLYWSGADDLDSQYLLERRGGKSREGVGRKVDRHPAQIARYEKKGYSQQFPSFSVFRKLCIVLQANPLRLLNLSLNFEGSGNELIISVINWVIECCDCGTKEKLLEIKKILEKKI